MTHTTTAIYDNSDIFNAVPDIDTAAISPAVAKLVDLVMSMTEEECAAILDCLKKGVYLGKQ